MGGSFGVLSERDLDGKIEYSPSSLGGLLRSVFGFSVQAKHAHHTLNLVSGFVILAEQCIPSIVTILG